MGEEMPKGGIKAIPREIRESDIVHHSSGVGTPPQLEGFPEGSLWNQTEPASNTTHEGELKDPALYDLPKGASLSTGPYTQDGIYIIGAPEHSAFRFFQTTPRVEGRLISRRGKLWIKQEDGTLTEPPPELQRFGWATTVKTHRLLPSHFKGADSAKPLPNLGKTEDWHFE